MNSLIATATHEQATVSSEIGMHLREIQQVAEGNDQDAEELERDGVALRALSGRLGDLSDKIQVSL